MFKVCRHNVTISQKSVLRLRQKYPLANFHVELFSRLRVSIPGDISRRSILLFQALRHGQFLHIAFARDADKDSGTLKT